MRNIKNFKQFESTDWKSEQNFVSDLEDITLELKDEGMIVSVSLINVIPTKEYEISITKPGFNRDLIDWSEIKDTVIRVTEYCYQNDSTVKFFADGHEFMIGFKKEEDFIGIGDGITQFRFRMLIIKKI